MAVQPRSRRARAQQDAVDLLQQLIDSPPAPQSPRATPVTLRSVPAQRRYALRGFLQRTWVDYALAHVERLLMVAALIVFGLWMADGPLRDWWHTQQPAAAPAPVVVAAPPVAATEVPQVDRLAALLPYTNPAVDVSADDTFMAPRSNAPDAPVVSSNLPTRLFAPSINVDTPVKEVFVVNGVWEVADYAAGFMHGTAIPGDPGNTVLAGHAGLRGGVFRDLNSLAIGDDIYLDAGGWRFHYRVREANSVWPNQTEVLNPTATPVLTLITCTNWDTQRLVIVADLLDSKPTPGT